MSPYDLPARICRYQAAMNVAKYQIWWKGTSLYIKATWYIHAVKVGFLRPLTPGTRVFYERVGTLKPRRYG